MFKWSKNKSKKFRKEKKNNKDISRRNKNVKRNVLNNKRKEKEKDKKESKGKKNVENKLRKEEHSFRSKEKISLTETLITTKYKFVILSLDIVRVWNLRILPKHKGNKKRLPNLSQN